MTPTVQRQLNVDRFQKLLLQETDPAKSRQIRRLLQDERLKPDSAYPPDAMKGPDRADHAGIDPG